LEHKIKTIAKQIFGQDLIATGLGGSIPFMEIFKDIFPEAKYFLTGCLFAESNAHAANENLDLEYCRKLTTTIAKLLTVL